MARISEAVENISAYSETGAALIEWAEEAGVIFARNDELEGAGVYSPSADGHRVSLNQSYAHRFEEVLAHELFHAVQRGKYDLRYSDFDATLPSLLNAVFMCEAGAETAGIRTVYEMKLNGFDEPFEASANSDEGIKKYNHLFRFFDASFKDAQRMGQGIGDALDYASDKTVDEYRNTADLIRAYTQALAIKFLQTVAMGHDKPLDFIITPTEMQGYTMLPNGKPLAKTARKPRDIKGLMQGKERWMQIVEWAEYKRMKSNKDTEVAAEAAYAKMEREDNPYRDIDVRRVLTQIDRQRGDDRTYAQSLFQTLHQFAGVPEARQRHFDFEPKGIIKRMKFPFS